MLAALPVVAPLKPSKKGLICSIFVSEIRQSAFPRRALMAFERLFFYTANDPTSVGATMDDRRPVDLVRVPR